MKLDMASNRDIKQVPVSSHREPGSRRRLVTPIALAVIVSVGGWLRIGGVDQVGIRFEDEAAYYADARLWYRCAQVAMDPVAIAALAAGDKEILRARVEHAGVRFQDRYRKPSQGFTVLGSAMMFVVGEGPGALVTVSALMGTASLILVYLIGAAICGSTVGLISATVLALSPYHLLYSRGAFADATLIFFCLLGVYWWIRGIGENRWNRTATILAGLSFGYALTCHYRSGYLIGVLALVEVVRVVGDTTSLTRNGLRALMSRWLTFGLMVLVPASAIELVFRFGQVAAWACEAQFPLRTYFESAYGYALAERAAGVNAGGGSFWGINLAALQGFVMYLNHLQGIPACALCGVGVIALGFRRGVKALPAVVVVVTLALLACQPFVVARGFSLALPFFAICTAVGLARVSTWMARRRTVALAVVSAALVALVVVPVLESTSAIRRRGSQLDDACAFLSSAGGGRAVVAEDTTKYDMLKGGTVELVVGRHYRASGSPGEMLRKMREDGIRWVIADPQRWHFRDARFARRDGVFFWWQEMEELLRVQAKLVFETRCTEGDMWEFLAEGPGLAYLEEMSRRGDGVIRIYELPPTAG